MLGAQADSRIANRRATALGGAFAILSLVLVIEYVTHSTLSELRSLIVNTHAVVRALEHLRTSLVEVSVARHQHALRPDESAESALVSAVAAARAGCTRVRVLTAGDLSEQALLNRIDPLVAAYLDQILAANSVSSQQRFDQERELRVTRETQKTYGEIVTLLNSAQQSEFQLLSRRRTAAEGISKRGRTAEALGLVISVGILLVVLRQLRREISLREQSESRLATTLDSIGDGVIVTDKDGRIDMSEERSAERRVHEATAFLDSIVENLPHMVFVKEPRELRFVRVNKAGEELLGTPRQALIGKNDHDFFPADQAKFFQDKDRDVLARRVLVDIPEEPIKTPAGERWLHTKKIPILDDDGQPLYLLGISEDITQKKATAEELLRAKTDLEQRVEDRTRDLRDANEELKKEIHERRQAEAALQNSEQQLRQSQKMEAVGRLAGGVAHDFNNLLSVILSYGDLVQRALPVGSTMRAEVEQITRAGMRAADLTRQLLAFSRQQMLAPKIVDLNASLDSMHKMLRRLIGEDIELRTLPSQPLARVKVDPSQMEQVIVNLAVNARDAMPSGGILTIETANVVLDATYAAEHPEIKPGPHIMLAVTDTGAGMDRETQARIFEPFFTTKEQGKGTGLGLSTVFGIVQQSGGSVWVYSEPGHGTTFKIYLPCALTPVPHVSTPSGAVSAAGTETVLLVEDDDQVRSLATTVLERSGFRVIAASGYEEALRFEAAFKDTIQLLVTDVVMPRMSGRQLAEQLSRLRPGMKVLFMSGYTDDTVVHHGVLDAGIQFLQKPLTPEGLTRKVREVLDAA